MNPDLHYFPILKGRMGEYGALGTMQPANKGLLTPIIEIPPIPWNYAANLPDKTIDQHLQKVSDSLRNSWGIDQRIFVDLMWIGEKERMVDGSHPLGHLFASSNEKGIQFVPVTGLARSQGYQTACRDAFKTGNHGLCLRLQREDFQDTRDIGSEISDLLSFVRATERQTDLVLDLRAIFGMDPHAILPVLIEMVETLPNIDAWRSLALCATAFPEDLMGIPPQNRTSLPRSEWTLWKELVAAGLALRTPSFGDYAIAHPQPSEVDPRIMRPSASIRYTTNQDWLILKGQNLRDHGYSQFHRVSADLLNEPEYSGPDFSWGDSYINKCARHGVSTGNLTTWRKVGTSHHLSFVVRQLANFSLP